MPAHGRFVKALYAEGLIGAPARDYALQMLLPPRHWGLWTSRLLLAIGTSLVLAGIVFFFAFNWAKMGAAAKFGVVEAALFGCLVAAYFADLQRLPGQTLLLCASVLTGVFLAVFGQIYQTGADAYTLFMAWAVLIAGWTVLSNFAPQWAVWLVICNVFAWLFWDQMVAPERNTPMLIYSMLAGLNLAFLVARELAVANGAEWLSGRWTRTILIVPILGLLLFPVADFIFGHDRSNFGTSMGTMLSLFTHIGLFFAYVKLRDIWQLYAVFLSGCIVIEEVTLRLLDEYVNRSTEHALQYFIGGVVTLAVFTFAVFALRKLAQFMEAPHAS